MRLIIVSLFAMGLVAGGAAPQAAARDVKNYSAFSCSGNSYGLDGTRSSSGGHMFCPVTRDRSNGPGNLSHASVTVRDRHYADDVRCQLGWSYSNNGSLASSWQMQSTSGSSPYWERLEFSGRTLPNASASLFLACFMPLEYNGNRSGIAGYSVSLD